MQLSSAHPGAWQATRRSSGRTGKHHVLAGRTTAMPPLKS
jgi:hypothetical protein